MQNPKVCPSCGTVLSPEDRFCAECGRPVETPSTGQAEADRSSPPPEATASPEAPRKRPRLRRCLLFFLLPLFLLAGGYLLALALWNGTTNNQLFRQRAICLAFDAEGARIAGGCADGTIRIWDPATGQEQARIHASEKAIAALAFGPRSGTLTGWDFGGTIFVLDIAAQKRIAAASRPQGFEEASIVFSGNLKTAAVEQKDNAVMILDPIRGDKRRTVSMDSFYSLALNNNGRLLAVAQYGRIVIVDCRTGKKRKVLEGAGTGGDAMGFSPDASTLAVGGYKKRIVLMDLRRGAKKRVFDNRGIFLNALAYGPKGRILAAACGSGGGSWGVTLFDADSGRQIRTIRQAPLWQRVLAMGGF